MISNLLQTMFPSFNDINVHGYLMTLLVRFAINEQYQWNKVTEKINMQVEKVKNNGYLAECMEEDKWKELFHLLIKDYRTYKRFPDSVPQQEFLKDLLDILHSATVMEIQLDNEIAHKRRKKEEEERLQALINAERSPSPKKPVINKKTSPIKNSQLVKDNDLKSENQSSPSKREKNDFQKLEFKTKIIAEDFPNISKKPKEKVSEKQPGVSAMDVNSVESPEVESGVADSVSEVPTRKRRKSAKVKKPARKRKATANQGESVSKRKKMDPTDSTMKSLKKLMSMILTEIQDHKLGYLYKGVDKVYAARPHGCLRPLGLKAIKANIYREKYTSMMSFFEDIALMIANVVMICPDDEQVRLNASEMQKFIQEKIHITESLNFL
eukprot:NODE_315_length_9989_cov_0.656825.p3 type:complete len:382 gc:universal NODE_315_length_9989_cov_0.656825:3164-2019(-)